jgi:FHA domain-containing protein
MSILEKLEKRIRETIQRDRRPREPLEILRALLNDIEEQVLPVGRGKRVFPFNHIVIQVAASDDEQRTKFEAFFEERNLESEVRAHLTRAGCSIQGSIGFELSIVDPGDAESKEKGFRIEYQKASPEVTPSSRKILGTPHGRLVTLQGIANPKSLTIKQSRTYIGRLSEILDERGNVVRRNDLAFLETEEEINQTVSRQHAHIQLNVKTGEFRLCDDDSVYGTSIFRDGRTIPVPGSNRRGAKLRSGDEIQLGRARVRFEIKTSR